MDDFDVMPIVPNGCDPGSRNSSGKVSAVLSVDSVAFGKMGGGGRGTGVDDDEDDPPALVTEGNAVPSKTSVNGISGVDSGLDKSDSCDSSDEISTKSDVNALSKGHASEDDVKLASCDGDMDDLFSPEFVFTVVIDAPGVENFELQVSSMELLQEICQVLMDREDTCHRTCFTLQLDGNTLDSFVEIKTIKGLKEGSVLKVVEEPYTMREARTHVRHVRDLLKSVDPCDAFSGEAGTSLSFVSTIMQGKKKGKTDVNDCTPPHFVLPGVKDLPIVPLLPFGKETRGPTCLKVLTTSGWNPPPGSRKLHGDMLYVYVVTLEDKHVHITASSRGFFVNQSTDDEFNPKPASPNSYMCHSLVETLSLISPGFKRNFAILQKKRAQLHPFERVPTPYQVHTWLAPSVRHTVDAFRAEDAFSSKLGYEEHIPGTTRDWNEEMQVTRELPRESLQDRLLRERAMFKVHSDFVMVATRGAMAVIDGRVPPVNPGDDPKTRLFLWNNIFFSLGFDIQENLKELGGDAAAHVAPPRDLDGVRSYYNVDVEGLYTLGTVVVDYRGYRVTAQSVVPGILERDQEHSIVYGCIDSGKKFLYHEKYAELLSKAAGQLKILPHKILNPAGEEIELFSSAETKGIIGTDGRHYILELVRTFPPDVNYLETDDEPDRARKALGYPIKLPHKFALLRRELVESFTEARYVMFVKYATVQVEQLGLKRRIAETMKESVSPRQAAESDDVVEKTTEKTDETGDKDDRKHVEKLAVEQSRAKMEDEAAIVEATKEALRKAAQFVGSVREADFEISFNADVYSPVVVHADEEALRKQRRLVKDAALFLVKIQIPGFVNECAEHGFLPSDGSTLVEAMHSRGINVRYLGRVAEKFVGDPRLKYVYAIAVSEMIARAAKHLFVRYMRGAELTTMTSAISLLLNCLLSSCPKPRVSSGDGELQTRNARKKRNRSRKPVVAEAAAASSSGDNTSAGVGPSDWSALTPKALWQQIKDDVRACYAFDLRADGIDEAVEKYGFPKISLLRSFCMKVGIQLLLRDYNFDSCSKQAFFEDDVVNLFPIVKHINPKANDAHTYYVAGQNKIQQGFFKEGFELVSEALNLFNAVYGAVHSDIARCLRMIARLNYIFGDHVEALEFQQRAVMISERVNGVDHPFTILEYTRMALYCVANGLIDSALKLLYRARYLAMVVHGECHPEMALLDSNLGVILHALSEYDLSVRFLENALRVSVESYGARSLKVALSHHLLARTQSCVGDFRSALQNEKETYAIYKNQLGEGHERTKESSDYLNHLTHQAVVMQKRMNEIYRVSSAVGGKTGGVQGTSSSTSVEDLKAPPQGSGVRPGTGSVANVPIPGNLGLPPLHIRPPTMGSVLDTLNIVNGVVFVQIRLKKPPEDPPNQQPRKEEEKSGPQISEDPVAVVEDLPVEDESAGPPEPESDS